ncbi:glycosyltransferase family 8 protein [Collybiopsis luxurians FD-317 M1]|nr:glycosyltransferase family 8 protein [Collybiopsis luxurians FD-317 M1]
MAYPYAFVTLLTSDHYLPGALTLAAALRDVHPFPPSSPQVPFQIVCLVTPETINVSTMKLLRQSFDVVIGVELIAQNDAQGLKLLGRPDLNEVLTKLHVFRLVQYQKIIFLDADVLPIRPLSHLFTLPHEFSAVPDVGWPDIFNSGVLVLTPGEDKFSELQQLLKKKGSWDGGDQGILNEWRGDNWNKLSFTYNTTPTAAYTYAPAYERFGKEISAIHFIGPNKPWRSIQYRPPFQSQRPPQESQESPRRAYDYDSLVDKWFNVYDTHYRAQVIIPDENFQVQKYVSAWDEQVHTGPTPSSGTIDLEELRRLAIQGLNSAGFHTDSRHGEGEYESRHGEGEYKSLPLEGRVDLMGPRPTPKAVKEEEEEETRLVVNAQPPPTPGPNEIPPSPHPQPIPLPPTPSLGPGDHPSSHEQQALASQHLYHLGLPSPQATIQPPSGEQTSHDSSHQPLPPQYPHSPPRPPSPPKLLWNPAIEPPPNTAPPASAFPSDTYFKNIWDQPPSKHHDRTHQQKQQLTSPTPDSGAFFEPPPPSQIPERIRDHYRNVTGESDRTVSTVPQPDSTKVKPIFPWEDQRRSKPERVFPASDVLPPTLFASPAAEEPENPSTPESEAVKEPISPPSKPHPPPPRGFPPTLSYANAWDTVPSIQRYASRLVRPPPPPPPPAPFDSEDYRRGRKNWDDQTEESSRDGDDEDNTDIDDGEPVVSRLADSDNETFVSSSTSRPRSRRGSSVSASSGIKSKKKEYRVRGVQTISPEMRNQAVQVAILVDPSKVSSTDGLTSQDQTTNSPTTSRPARLSLTLQTGNGRKPQWATSSAPSALPPVVSSGRGVSPDLKNSTGTSTKTGGDDTLDSFSPPPDELSPREFGFSGAPQGVRPGPPDRSNSTSTVTPASAIAPAIVQRTSGSPQTLSAQPPLEPLRQISNDSVTSPSSAGPISPPEGQPIGSIGPPRKVGRVFDPARGVEVFKRGSEEVLARFLKMSSWEDESSPQQ